ncbi:glycosyltransferase family 2 protein [Escherichia coli]
MINIIIVSHQNLADIDKILTELAGENDYYTIYVRDNVADENLKRLCSDYNVSYCSGIRREGFALNNNIAAEKVLHSCEIADDDYFLFMNPDAYIIRDELIKLSTILSEKKYDMFTVDLYSNDEYTIRDPSIRYFPTLKIFLSSFLFDTNKSIINRDAIHQDFDLDWCASSFFGVKVGLFKRLNGFDSRFFMYCEDVDICYRAKKLGAKLSYIANVKAIHYTQKNSKKMLTKNFYWHVKSAILFLWKKHTLSKG